MPAWWQLCRKRKALVLRTGMCWWRKSGLKHFRLKAVRKRKHRGQIPEVSVKAHRAESKVKCQMSEVSVFHGKIEFIRSLANYEGTDVKNLRIAFEEAVDDYLELCEQEGKEPEIPFKGSFNDRTGPDLHRKAMLLAKSKGTNLNSIITDALEKYLSTNENI